MGATSLILRNVSQERRTLVGTEHHFRASISVGGESINTGRACTRAMVTLVVFADTGTTAIELLHA